MRGLHLPRCHFATTAGGWTANHKRTRRRHRSRSARMEIAECRRDTDALSGINLWCSTRAWLSIKMARHKRLDPRASSATLLGPAWPVSPVPGIRFWAQTYRGIGSDSPAVSAPELPVHSAVSHPLQVHRSTPARTYHHWTHDAG